MVGYSVLKKESINSGYICPYCLLLLRDPVQLIDCGHRLCQSCVDEQKGHLIICSKCHEKTSREKLKFDRGFQNDIQALPTICAICNWTGVLKNYQEHHDQFHRNRKCEYCHEQFHTIDQLNQHQVSQCQRITIGCLLKDFGCRQQIVRCELSNHYLTKKHQDSIVNVIQQMKSQLRDAHMPITRMDTDTLHITTTAENSFAINQIEELDETMSILENGIQALKEDMQRLNNELFEHKTKLQSLIENILQVKVAVEEKNAELWKITNFQEKIRDAQSERQTSIYSPAFYSFPVGYKMRARLYLNGDGNARQTHMSIFFVLMRGQNNPILKFPFYYKVVFCLYDQTSDQRHIIESFRPDLKSSSFQRPRFEMNIASGIPKFIPLAMIQQEGNPYVRDDTMFVKIMVDFADMSKRLLAFAFSLNPGLPTNVQQDIIRQEAERQAQVQTSQEEQTMN